MSTNRIENSKESALIEEVRDMSGSRGAKKVWLLTRGIEVLLGLTFVLGAVLKAIDISTFAVQVSYYGIIREPTAVRLVALCAVLAETAIGVALLVGWRLRGWTLRTVFLLLLGFTGLILYAWAFEGLEDCGCFGSYVKMGPGASVLKNLVMMALVAGAWIGYRKTKAAGARQASTPKRIGLVRAVSAAACCALVLAALTYGYSRQESGGTSGPITAQPYSENQLFAQFQFEADGKEWDLGSGDYFVVLLSDSCEHCAETMEKLNELPLFLPTMPPIVALMLGEEEILDQLRDRVKPQYPTVLIEPLTFFQLLDDATAPPRFVYLQDGKEMHHWNDELPEDTELMEIIAGLANTLP